MRRPAELGVEDWAGRWWQPVVVVGETPKRYRIEAPAGGTRLAGRWLAPGERALVPKHAVRFRNVPGRSAVGSAAAGPGPGSGG